MLTGAEPLMKKMLVALALAASTVAFVPGQAHAATTFANCTALHKVYKYGVAKS